MRVEEAEREGEAMEEEREEEENGEGVREVEGEGEEEEENGEGVREVEEEEEGETGEGMREVEGEEEGETGEGVREVEGEEEEEGETGEGVREVEGEEEEEGETGEGVREVEGEEKEEGKTGEGVREVKLLEGEGAREVKRTHSVRYSERVRVGKMVMKVARREGWMCGWGRGRVRYHHWKRWGLSEVQTWAQGLRDHHMTDHMTSEAQEMSGTEVKGQQDEFGGDGNHGNKPVKPKKRVSFGLHKNEIFTPA